MQRTAVRALLASVALSAVVWAGQAWAAPVLVEPGAAQPAAFQPSGDCGCHSSLVEQWSPTMHAQALSDPIYLAKLKEAQEATDGKIGAFCNKCHGPIATMTSEIGSSNMSPASQQGITCTFCHYTVGLEGETANTSHLVELDQVRRAQLKDPQAPHPAAYSEFHESAEICGGCHNVNHPVNGMHLEATYTEWKESPYAEEGIVCQDCHMSIEPGQIGPFRGQAAGGAPERDNIYKLSFVGGQVALGPSEVAIARLQSAAEMELEVPEIVGAGQKAPVKVTITNSGAGHYLPTGLTEVRQMWLEVYAEDAEGNRTPIGERRFGTILKDAKGRAPVELWEAEEIASDDRIPPRESVSEEYEFTMPEGAEASQVKAALLYKSVPDELAEKAGVENPTTEMAVAVSDVFVSEAAKTAASQPVSPETPGPNWTTLAIVVGVIAVAAAGFFVWRRGRTSS